MTLSRAMPQPTDRPTWRYGNAEAELLDYHLSMLLDDERMRAYQERERR